MAFGVGSRRVLKYQWKATTSVRSALFYICQKDLGHLLKFTQCSIPYHFGLAG